MRLVLYGCLLLLSASAPLAGAGWVDARLGEPLPAVMYGLARDGTVLLVEPSCGVALGLGSVGVADLGYLLAYDPFGARLYTLADNYRDPQLVAIDPLTGAGTVVGRISPSGESWSAAESLAFNTADKALYAAGGPPNTPSSRLVRIDPSTGRGTFVSPLSGMRALNDADAMEFVGGRLYAADMAGPDGPSYLHSVDLASGRATYVGVMGTPALDFAWHAGDGNTYALGYDDASFGNGLHKIDLATGSATRGPLVHRLGDPTVAVEMNGIAAGAAAHPLHAALGLLGPALCALGP